MIDGVSGPGSSLSRLERRHEDPSIGLVGTPWWCRLTSMPRNLRKVLGELFRATHDVSQRGVRDHETRVHRGQLDSDVSGDKPIAMSRRRSWNGARCLVTGASSGLGKALAERLRPRRARVVLTGRSVERLQAAAQGLIDEGADPARIVTIPADLTIDEDRQRLFDQLAEHFEALDLVVNNAGVGATGQFESHDPAVLRKVFEINVFALAEVCRAALPLLAQGKQPALVNMGSVVARRGLPSRTEYSASKFAVTRLSQALRVEWRRFGIHVLQVNPGFTNTPFDQHAVANTARYTVARHRLMSADAVAIATLRAVERQKREIVLTWQGKLLILVDSMAPRFVDWGFSRWLFLHYPDSPILQRDHSRHPVPVR